MYPRMGAYFCHALHQSCLESKRQTEGNISLPASLPNIWKICLATPVASCRETQESTYRCCHLISSIQAQVWCSLFPIHLLETWQERSSMIVFHRLCRHSLRNQEPVSQRLKLRPLSKEAWSWVSRSYRKKTCKVCRL